jgi:hypothetical protein
VEKLLEIILTEEKYDHCLKNHEQKLLEQQQQVMNNLDLKKEFCREVNNIQKEFFANEKARKNFSPLFNHLTKEVNFDKSNSNSNSKIKQNPITTTTTTTENLNQDQPEVSVVVGIETQHMIVVPKWILESLKSKSKEIMKSRNFKKRTSGTIVGEIMELLKELEEME